MQRPLAARVLHAIWDSFADPSQIGSWFQVLRYTLLHPRDAYRWSRYCLRPLPPLELGLPWISWGSIDFLEDRLRPSHRVFEWGGGGSTLYFALRCEEVNTVESDVEWECLIDQRLRRAGEAIRKRVSLRLSPVMGRPPKDLDAYVDYVHEGAPWDVVLVDGAMRLRCVREAAQAVKSGGLLILDNADYGRYGRAPSILPGWKRLTFRGLGFGRRWVTQTDIYIAP